MPNSTLQSLVVVPEVLIFYLHYFPLNPSPNRLCGSHQGRTTGLENLLHREEGIPRWHLSERGVHSFQGAPQHFPQIRGKHQAFR